MRIYIIGNDGITLSRPGPAALNESEIAVASKEGLHAVPLSGKRLLHKIAFVMKTAENLDFSHRRLGLDRNSPGHQLHSWRVGGFRLSLARQRRTTRGFRPVL